MTVYFSTDLAVALTLLAATMWGSWMQIVKHRGGYPITGILFLLYTFSLLLVGGVTATFAPCLLEESFWSVTARNLPVVREILFGGALMGAGMFLSLVVMNNAGLLLATTISGAVGTLLGLATSLLKEGIPQRPGAVPLVLLIATVSIVAGLVCNAASQSRDRDMGKRVGDNTVTLPLILMALVAAACGNGWSIGTASGTANRLPPILTCFYMALGCFLSAMVICGISFNVNRQWKQVLCLGDYPKKPLLLGVIAALCHYGGNLISIYSMPTLSATVSFLFGRFATAVTIFWGLFYGEFAGSSRRTKIILTIGILLYFLNFIPLGIYTYG